MPFSKDKPIIYSSTLGEFSPCKLTAEEKAAMTEADKIEYLRTRYGEHTDRLVELFRKAYPDHDIIDLGYYDSGYRLASLISAKKHLEAGTRMFVSLRLQCSRKWLYADLYGGSGILSE